MEEGEVDLVVPVDGLEEGELKEAKKGKVYVPGFVHGCQMFRCFFYQRDQNQAHETIRDASLDNVRDFANQEDCSHAYESEANGYAKEAF